MFKGSYNEWSKLEEVIVGVPINSSLPKMKGLDEKIFYYDNITGEQALSSDISQIKIDEMNEDIYEFIKVLKSFNVKVKRPETLNKRIPFKTPYWKGTHTPALNVRDMCLVIGDNIIETPPLLRHRYFELDHCKKIFMDYFNDGAKWFLAPKPKMLNESFDLNYINQKNISSNFEIMFDAAQCIRLGNDIIMNCSSQNHILGYKWLKSILPNFNIHKVSFVDNHIDSTLLPLKDGVFLANELRIKNKIDQLPKKFNNWKIIWENTPIEDDNNKNNIASTSIGMNVFSIDENHVVVDKKAKNLIKKLEQHKFTPIPLNMRHSRIFGGSFHCITLDTKRKL